MIFSYNGICYYIQLDRNHSPLVNELLSSSSVVLCSAERICFPLDRRANLHSEMSREYFNRIKVFKYS
jgi:hypothetical protein